MPGLNLLMDRIDGSVQGRTAGIYTSRRATRPPPPSPNPERDRLR
jgi:hypothetical protein